MLTLDEILLKLKECWPQYNIEFYQSYNRAKHVLFLKLDGKILFEFNTEQLEYDLQFLQDRDDYQKIVFDLFNNKIIKYHKKYSKKIFNVNGQRGLSIQQVKEACSMTNSNNAAAKYLHISYQTWRKYAKIYVNEDDPQKRVYFDTQYNKKGFGIKRPRYVINETQGYTIQDLLDGEISLNYPSSRLKNRLIKLGLILDECSSCGFTERRITDGKIPLILTYIDGNEMNKKAENIRLLCYNCHFLQRSTHYYMRKDGSNSRYDKLKKEKNENKTR